MPFDFQKHRTVEAPWNHRQCLGRLFRVRPLTVEEKVIMKVKIKIITLAETTESTGESLHLFPFQEKAADKILKSLAEDDKFPSA